MGTADDPFEKIVERRQRDTKNYLRFIEICGFVAICEVVYVFRFRKV
jgi:hypothetical protein